MPHIDLAGAMHDATHATFGPGTLRAALADALDMDPEFVRVWGHVPAEQTLHGRDVMLRIELLVPYER